MHKVSHIPVLTIDGLSGTGKTSITSQIASELRWNVLYSGFLYRYLGYAKQQMRYAKDDDYAISPELRQELSALSCRVNQAGEVIILLENENLSHCLATEEIGKEASHLAGIQSIRKQLLSIQRSMAKAPGLVAEGRDMGRVVFPGANLKVYLIADEEVRVQRRYNQLNRRGNNVKIDQVAHMQHARDSRDQQQAYQRLDSSPTELVIDTTNMSMQAVKERIYQGLLEREVVINT